MPDRSARDWYTRYQRASTTPGCIVAEFRAGLTLDVRAILPSIQVPTLAMVSSGLSGERHLETGQYIGNHLPGARSITNEEPSDQIHWLHWYGRAPSILRETGAFIASIREEQEAFDRVLATVLFTDIVDSTATAARLGDTRWRSLIDELDRRARTLVARYRGEYVHSTGDGVLATFDGPARAIRCAQTIVESVRALGVEIRAGLHTGEVTRADHGIAGVGVHIGARVASLAGPGEVWVSTTVKDLVVGSGMVFEDAGEHELKGVPERWRLYRVVTD
jgi:class 3 adenylate cyclase